MIQHYTWPDLGERIQYKGLTGTIVSRHIGPMEFTVMFDNFQMGVVVKLEDFIVDQIRNPK
jgi:hypothetical protein